MTATQSWACAAESAASLSAYCAYSASTRAGDGVAHGLRHDGDDRQRRLQRLAASAPRFSAEIPPLPARIRLRLSLLIYLGGCHSISTSLDAWCRTVDDPRVRRRSVRCGDDSTPGRRSARADTQMGEQSQVYQCRPYSTRDTRGSTGPGSRGSSGTLNARGRSGSRTRRMMTPTDTTMNATRVPIDTMSRR